VLRKKKQEGRHKNGREKKKGAISELKKIRRGKQQTSKNLH